MTAPVCRATNAVNLQGVVGVIYTETQVARLYSCESDQWGEWFKGKSHEPR